MDGPQYVMDYNAYKIIHQCNMYTGEAWVDHIFVNKKKILKTDIIRKICNS